MDIKADKERVLNNLKASHDIHNFQESPNWADAFNLFHKVTGTRLKMNCGKCFKAVKEWLEA